MSLQFDSTRAPVTTSEFKSLVKAVNEAGPSDEAEWIEWKSVLDLTSAADKAALARAITGFANRVLPGTLAHCEGRAYVLVGVEPGRIAGINQVDPAVLEDRLRPYLGDDGPRWAPHWVSIEGKSVLVVEVASPRDGDLIHHIRKGGPKVEDGEIFIRRGAKTANPSSVELRALLGRFRTVSELQGLHLAIGEPEEVSVVDYSEHAIEQWLSDVKKRLLRSLNQSTVRQQSPRHLGDLTPKSRSTGPSFSELQDLAGRKEAGESLSVEEEATLIKELEAMRTFAPDMVRTAAEALSWMEDERSPEEYKAEVATYLERCREAMPEVIRLAAGEKLPQTLFLATNETRENYAKVRFVVYIPGSVEAVPNTSRASNVGRLPRPPRPFGPRRVSPSGRITASMASGWMSQVNHLTTHFGQLNIPGTSVDIRNGGSTTLTFSPIDLRPLESDVALAPLVLLPQVPIDSAIMASWEATSVSVRGVARGNTGLRLGTDPRSLAELLTD